VSGFLQPFGFLGNGQEQWGGNERGGTRLGPLFCYNSLSLGRVWGAPRGPGGGKGGGGPTPARPGGGKRFFPGQSPWPPYQGGGGGQTTAPENQKKTPRPQIFGGGISRGHPGEKPKKVGDSGGNKHLVGAPTTGSDNVAAGEQKTTKQKTGLGQ